MKKMLFFLLFAAKLFSQPTPPTKIEQQILSLTYNEDFRQAKSLAQELIKTNPTSPKYYYYLINLMIMDYYQKISELDTDKRDVGRKSLNKEIITYCEDVVDKFEEANLNTENKFYLGTIYAYLARVYGVNGSWWSAFKSGKQAKSMMEEVLKSDPRFYDAYLVIGMISYYADRMSGVTSFIAGALGFSGDRTKGLAYSKTAYDKGTLTVAQSNLTLIEVYTNLEDNLYEAVPYYENFIKYYPHNKRALNSYCQLLLNLWNLKRVESLIKNDKQNLVENFIKTRYYDALGNSEMAIKLGELAFNQKSLLRGAENSVRYILAYNSWLAGDNARTKKYEYELNDRNKETFEIVKKNPAEAKWLHGLSVMAITDAKENEFEIYIQSKPVLKNTPGFEEQFNLITGQYYFNNNMFDKAEQYFSGVTNSTNKGDKYTALKFMVEIYNRQSVTKTKVKNLLNLIDDFDNERLKFRASDLEKKYGL
jgi:hypothetical protein